jgi:hypothetical protein
MLIAVRVEVPTIATTSVRRIKHSVERPASPAMKPLFIHVAARHQTKYTARTARYRLRKKLGINGDESIEKMVSEI